LDCPHCQHDNAANAHFCESCGARLQRTCGDCGEPLSLRARFCSQCGRPTSDASATLASAPQTPLQPVIGERRQLTAMFCDMVGSTALSQHLDPEELGVLVAIHQGVCMEAVTRFDGHVAQLLGDGVLVYFGYPQAHEDDAQRAIRAALAIQAALTARNAGRRGPDEPELRARIGIHTGTVVVSTLGGDVHHERLALGNTVNIAARLETIAEPGAIVMSEATLRLVAGLFVTRDLGTPPLKGVGEPIRVHAVERVAGVSARGAAARPAAPLLGRDRELGLLLDRWEQVQAGFGQVIAISGEPGIGKSRLLREFRERISADAHTALDLACSPFGTRSAFAPAIELFERGFAFAEDDAPETRLAKLEAGVAQIPGIAAESVVPYLAALLGLPASERFPLEHMSADVQREKTLTALAAPTLAMVRLQPLVMSVEDLHWSDPSTLDLLGRLIEQVPSQRLMLVLTYRPSLTPPWPLTRSYVTPVSLSRLTHRATLQVIEASAGLKLPERVLEDIAERTDGVPLFAEELARALVESGVGVASNGRFELRGRLADLSIPTTLQGSLMARLDRLGLAKPVAQIAATLGREFSYALIEALGEVSQPFLRSGLDQLVKAEILYGRGEPPDATYTFKHALLQDTAYESQLKSRRRELHARVAATLEERFGARVAAEPQVVAHHCAEGGLTERAIEHYAQAGRQALSRLASPEAAGYFARALELLASLPETVARRQQEISLRLALSGPLSPRGDTSEAVANFTRIEALCERLDPGSARLPALVGLAVLHQARADLKRSARWAHELLEVAESLDIKPLRVAGHAMLGATTASFVGFAESCRHFNEMNRLAAETQMPPPVAAFDLDVVGGFSGAYSMSLALAGKPKRALEVLASGLDRTRKLGHAFSHAFASQMGAMTHYFLEDPERVLEAAGECFEVSRGRGFVMVEAHARALSGWARAMLGDSDGAAEFEQGLALALSGGGSGVEQMLVEGAELSLALGPLERVNEYLERASAWCQRVGSLTTPPNVPVLQAALLLRTHGDLAEAERLLVASLAAWRRVTSPWMEVRSACLLAEIALRTGDRAPARDRLAALLASFDEGAETKRLREARELLARLG